MTEQADERWLVIGWPFDNYGGCHSASAASLIEYAGDDITRTEGVISETLIHEKVLTDRETYPGIIPLHDLPASEAQRYEDSMSEHAQSEETERRASSAMDVFHASSPRTLTTLYYEMHYIQQCAVDRLGLVQSQSTGSRPPHYVETVREICRMLVVFLGLEPLRAGSVRYELGGDDQMKCRVTVEVELPVDRPSLARVTVSCDKIYCIDFSAEYRFGADEQWYELFDGDVFSVTDDTKFYWKGPALELLSLFQRGLSGREIVDYLGVWSSERSVDQWATFSGRSPAAIQENLDRVESKLEAALEPVDAEDG
jgi:hypothetical protein